VSDLESVRSRLSAGGFLAAEDEALELLQYSNGDTDQLESRIKRRLQGEPLAWITGFTTFCGIEIRVDPGVYVPRGQSEPLARRAAARLPHRGIAVDLCTGTGAIAKALLVEKPTARVIGIDIDERAVSCARSNGIEALCGDLFAPLSLDLEGRVDVISGVVPYVPTQSMPFLARDTLDFESPLSYDGGSEGVDVLRRVLEEGQPFLRPGGSVFVEVGGRQAEVLRGDLERLGFDDVNVIFDQDGDLRGLEATRTK
jgi:release factor glutamine methyltransferase